MTKFMVKLPKRARPIKKWRANNFSVVCHWNKTEHMQIIRKLHLPGWYLYFTVRKLLWLMELHILQDRVEAFCLKTYSIHKFIPFCSSLDVTSKQWSWLIFLELLAIIPYEKSTLWNSVLPECFSPVIPKLKFYLFSVYSFLFPFSCLLMGYLNTF